MGRGRVTRSIENKPVELFIIAVTLLSAALSTLRVQFDRLIDHKPAREEKISFILNILFEVLLDPDVLDDILAEDAGVGHDGTEDEHDAGEDPDGERGDPLRQHREHKDKTEEGLRWQGGAEVESMYR